MAKEAKIDFDEKNDILYVSTGQSVSDSVDFDNFVIDFSKEGMIVGVEIMKASEFIEKFEMKKEFLLHVQRAALSIIQSREYSLIKIVVYSSVEMKELYLPSPVPQTVMA